MKMEWNAYGLDAYVLYWDYSPSPFHLFRYLTLSAPMGPPHSNVFTCANLLHILTTAQVRKAVFALFRHTVQRRKMTRLYPETDKGRVIIEVELIIISYYSIALWWRRRYILLRCLYNIWIEAYSIKPSLRRCCCRPFIIISNIM